MINIRSITKNDTENIVKWRNSNFVKKNLYSQDDITIESHNLYFDKYILTKKCYQFIIELSEGNNVYDIGTVFLKNIDDKNLKCELGIFIGELSFLGKGYGKEATKKAVEFAFDVLKMHKVYLTVLEKNCDAIKTYKNSGFKIDGILIDDYYRNNEFYNVVIMSCINNNC